MSRQPIGAYISVLTYSGYLVDSVAGTSEEYITETSPAQPSPCVSICIQHINLLQVVVHSK